MISCLLIEKKIKTLKELLIEKKNQNTKGISFSVLFFFQLTTNLDKPTNVPNVHFFSRLQRAKIAVFLVLRLSTGRL